MALKFSYKGQWIFTYTIIIQSFIEIENTWYPSKLLQHMQCFLTKKQLTRHGKINMRFQVISCFVWNKICVLFCPIYLKDKFRQLVWLKAEVLEYFRLKIFTYKLIRSFLRYTLNIQIYLNMQQDKWNKIMIWIEIIISFHILYQILHDYNKSTRSEN